MPQDWMTGLPATHLLETAKRLAVEAGRRAMDRCGSVACELKTDATLVTEVDRETEELLCSELRRETPEIAFLGEEFGLRGDPEGPLWACDPIDGTTNFYFGMPHWGVSLGLIVQDTPVLGVIYLPMLNELFWAVRGEGAWCNGRRMRAQDTGDLLQEDTLCLTSNSVKTLRPEELPCRLRLYGSIATELAYTARGNLRATVGLHEGLVDMAAGFVILEESGCGVRYLNGDPMDIQELRGTLKTTRHFVAAPPLCMDYLLRTLRLR